MITHVEGLVGGIDKLIVRARARISIKRRMDESLINFATFPHTASSSLALPFLLAHCRFATSFTETRFTFRKYVSRE